MSTAASHPRSDGPSGTSSPRRNCIVVMGVAGCGKTTVGEALAAALGLAYQDGDTLHGPANVAKMSAGIPLTDEDRWPWLDRIGAALSDASANPAGLVIGCSALKKAYRDRLRVAAPGLAFLFLDISREMAAARTSSRPGHFMPTSLVDSQFAALERPDGEDGVVTAPADMPVAAIVSRFVDEMKEWTA